MSNRPFERIVLIASDLRASEDEEKLVLDFVDRHEDSNIQRYPVAVKMDGQYYLTVIYEHERVRNIKRKVA